MIFMAPTVEPEEPPIIINTINIISDKLGHVVMYAGEEILAPVVVIAEITWNNVSTGSFLVRNMTPSVARMIRDSMTWTCMSLKNDFPLVLIIL